MEPKQADVSIPLQSSGWGAAAPPGPRSDPQPRDYVLWSVFNMLLWSAVGGLGCLGFPGLIYSVKARDSKLVGDLEGARRHSGRAKVANIICSVLVAVVVLIIIIVIAVVVSERRRVVSATLSELPDLVPRMGCFPPSSCPQNEAWGRGV